MNSPQAPSLQPPPRYTSDEARWTAVVGRDAGADGAFVFSVRSTGVYCRPGCPARTPRRENVRFHPSCAAAEHAGFRPCKRCNPHLQSRIERDTALVTQACRSIETAAATATLPTLDTLAAAAGLSRYHFHRLFKSITGVTPKAYALAQRDHRVRAALPESRSVTEAIYASGHGSSASFYGRADAMLGMMPSRYRQGGADETLRYALDRCSLGNILVAATEKGICAVLLGDDKAALIDDLRQRFPQAELLPAGNDFQHWLAMTVRLVDAGGSNADLPLDVRGTAFQQRVWQALREIPPGTTTSYGEIAQRIGVSPRAVRAVAGAIAANPLAVVIPCHRVLRRDGHLAGYRWGIERKQALLEREARTKAAREKQQGKP